MAVTEHLLSNNKTVHRFLTFFKQHWVIVLIVVTGAFLRTWKLNTLGILFSDAGRDVLAAQAAVHAGTVPLVGIPSSVPRFHQGPVTIWLHMLVYAVAGDSMLAFSLVFACLSILALILTYEFCVVHINKPTALAASAILAVSPLAVAHARVPYHITPIPLVVIIFLFALVRLWKKQPQALFWAVLSWGLLMQFELALFGLCVVIGYILWKKQYRFNRYNLAETTAAGLIGFLPQIIHDLTHPFHQSQLAAFFAWVGYRVISLTGITGKHQFNWQQLSTTFRAFGLYGQRIFSTDHLIISLIVAAILLATAIMIFRLHRRKALPLGIELATIVTVILTISYMAHGSPSEAYFPPYTIVLSILVGFGLTRLLGRYPRALAGLLAVYAIVTVITIFQHSFFVSNTYAFNYGPSIGEQRAMLDIIAELNGPQFSLRTTDEGKKFAAYLDNYKCLAREQGYQVHPNAPTTFIDTKNSALNGYPGINKIEFSSRDVYFY